MATAPFAGMSHTADRHRPRRAPILAVPPGYLRHLDLPLPARPCAPARGARPAAGRDAAGAGRRHRFADAHHRARGHCGSGLRRCAGHCDGRRVPAAEPAARAGPRTAAGQRRDCRWNVRRHARARRCPTITRRRRPRRSPGHRTARSGRCRCRSTRRAWSPARRSAHARRPDRQPRRAHAAGQVQFVDDLSDQLNSAAGDALYAETLYVMLAVPARSSRSGSRTSPRSAPSIATAVTCRCFAPAAPPAASRDGRRREPRDRVVAGLSARRRARGGLALVGGGVGQRPRRVIADPASSASALAVAGAARRAIGASASALAAHQRGHRATERQGAPLGSGCTST